MEVLTKILGGCGQLLNGIHQQAVCFYLLIHSNFIKSKKRRQLQCWCRGEFLGG